METWKQAILKKDAKALEPLLHPDLLYSHSDGRTETKADILKSLPNRNPSSSATARVRVYGNTALVKGPWNSSTTPPPRRPRSTSASCRCG